MGTLVPEPINFGGNDLYVNAIYTGNTSYLTLTTSKSIGVGTVTTISTNTPPSSTGNWNSITTAFTGDNSQAVQDIAYFVTGASTLSNPTSGYVYTYERTPVNIYVFNQSGWNQDTAGNTGRTAVVGHHVKVDNFGQGDGVCYNGIAFVDGSRSGATNFLANPAGVVFNGQVTAGTAGVYLNAVEVTNADQGFDVAGIGYVINSNRSVSTGSLSSYWNGFRTQSIGSKPIDAHYVGTGSASVGLDLTTASTNTAIQSKGFTLTGDGRINITSPASIVGGNSFNLITTNGTAGFSGSGQVSQLTLNFNAGGAGGTGSFNTLNAVLNVNASTANTSVANYCTAEFVAQGAVQDSANASLFGINPNVRLISGATSWLQIIGEEIDIAVASGASVSDKIGMQIVQTSVDQVAGSRANIGFTLANGASTASGWDVGYGFGAYTGYNPMSVSGTLIGTMGHSSSNQSYGVSGSMGTTKYGIDFTGYTFSGAPLVMPLQAPATASSTGKVGSVCWDSSGFIYICVSANNWKRVSTASW